MDKKNQHYSTQFPDVRVKIHSVSESLRRHLYFYKTVTGIFSFKQLFPVRDKYPVCNYRKTIVDCGGLGKPTFLEHDITTLVKNGHIICNVHMTVFIYPLAKHFA